MRIVVIGAGPAGLAAAAYLGRSGHEVEILERAAEPRPIGFGLLLQPSGFGLLDEIGALREAGADAARIVHMDACSSSGRTLIDLDYADLAPGLHGLGMSRPALWSALVQASLRHGARIIPGHTVSAITRSGTGASIRTNRGSIAADLVVVASGAHTDLLAGRKKHVSRPYRWGCLWGTLALPPDWPTDALRHRCAGTGVMLGILPTRVSVQGNEAALLWSVRNDSVPELLARPAAEWRDAVARTWPEAEQLVENLGPGDLVHATYRDVWADPPHDGAVVAVGDAAHGTSLHLGQGTTQALRDAAALADALDASGTLAERMSRYWQVRRARTRYYRMASRALTPVFQSSIPVLGRARDILAGPVGRIPFVRRQALLTLAGAKSGLCSADPI